MTEDDATSGRRKLLFLGPLPEPTTGHSLACQVLLEGISGDWDVSVVDLSHPVMADHRFSVRRGLRTAWNIVRIFLGNFKSDLIYLTITESKFGNLKDLIIYALCVLRLKRMVIHLHGGSLKRDVFDKYPILNSLNRFFLPRLGGVVILGNSHRSIFKDIVDDSRIHVVANFSQAYLLRDCAEIIEKFSSSETLNILYLSNFIEGKGYGDLLEAVEALPDADRRRVRVDWAGLFDREACRAAFLDRISRLPGNRYHGAVLGERKAQLLSEAHLFVLPTRFSEGQPISILEAYASGCVVVTTARGGIVDIFSDGTNGFEIPVRDPARIVDVIGSACRNVDGLKEIGLRNRDIAARWYRPQTYVQNMKAVFEQVYADA